MKSIYIRCNILNSFTQVTVRKVIYGYVIMVKRHQDSSTYRTGNVTIACVKVREQKLALYDDIRRRYAVQTEGKHRTIRTHNGYDTCKVTYVYGYVRMGINVTCTGMCQQCRFYFVVIINHSYENRSRRKGYSTVWVADEVLRKG